MEYEYFPIRGIENPLFGDPAVCPYPSTKVKNESHQNPTYYISFESLCCGDQLFQWNLGPKMYGFQHSGGKNHNNTKSGGQKLSNFILRQNITCFISLESLCRGDQLFQWNLPPKMYGFQFSGGTTHHNTVPNPGAKNS